MQIVKEGAVPTPPAPWYVGPEWRCARCGTTFTVSTEDPVLAFTYTSTSFPRVGVSSDRRTDRATLACPLPGCGVPVYLNRGPAQPARAATDPWQCGYFLVR